MLYVAPVQQHAAVPVKIGLCFQEQTVIEHGTLFERDREGDIRRAETDTYAVIGMELRELSLQHVHPSVLCRTRHQAEAPSV